MDEPMIYIMYSKKCDFACSVVGGSTDSNFETWITDPLKGSCAISSHLLLYSINI